MYLPKIIICVKHAYPDGRRARTVSAIEIENEKCGA